MPTAKQARFIAEFVKDLNGSDAAVRAGYRPSSARHTASRLLQKPHIRVAVQQLQAEQLEKVGITAEGVLEQLRRIAFFDVASIYEWIERDGKKVRRLLHPADWPVEARTALASMDVALRSLAAGDGIVDRVAKVKLESKLHALELLAKHLGLLTDRAEEVKDITIRWLPPEPLPQIETIDADGAPPSTLGRPGSRPALSGSNGFGRGPPRPSREDPCIHVFSF